VLACKIGIRRGRHRANLDRARGTEQPDIAASADQRSQDPHRPDRRISRHGRDQRSSRCATGLSEGERAERRFCASRCLAVPGRWLRWAYHVRVAIRLTAAPTALGWRTRRGPGTTRFPAPLVTGMGDTTGRARRVRGAGRRAGRSVRG
jgi:hypothetical protein